MNSCHDEMQTDAVDEGEFTVAWLTFKGDAVEKDDNRQAARKRGLLSSKLLKNLFGESTIKAFEACEGDHISREAFISTLVSCYLGNTEDRIAFIFTMYTITYGHERVGENFISEPDYLDFLDYLALNGHVHKKLYDAFEECKIPSGSMLPYSQFLSWVRSYPSILEYLVEKLPPVNSQDDSPLETPLSIRTNDEPAPPNSDPLNTSPSCRTEKLQKGHMSSFDFIGGEDSGDDSDELYDSDQISELDEPFESNFQAPPSGGLQLDDKSDSSDVENHTMHDVAAATAAASSGPAAPATPLSFPGTGASVLNSFGARRMDKEKKSRSSRSNVQKMGRLGKAVGGGISKVGRNLLHAGKQSASVSSNRMASSGSSSGGPNETTVGGKPQSLGGIYGVQSFSSECRMNEHYVCGYLNKISDGKWSKRSWHRRWFVLDRQCGMLSYYRLNPANNMNVATRGTVVHMEDISSRTSSIQSAGKSAEVSSSSPIKEDNNPRSAYPSSSTSGNAHSGSFAASGGVEPSANSNVNPADGSREVLNEQASSEPATTTTTKDATSAASSDKNALSPASTLVYMNKAHPWYRGEMDLNKDGASLLFEKHLARNAPTQFFFQVSSLSLAELETRRGGIQFKLCADNYHDFDRWTQALSEVINRKHSERHSQEKHDHPPLSHQQIYRQRLQAQQRERQQAKEKEDSSPTHEDFKGSPKKSEDIAPSPATRIMASPILNESSLLHTSSSMLAHSPTQWRLAIHLEGYQEIFVAGFLLFAVTACMVPASLAFMIVTGYAATVYLQTTSLPLCSRLGAGRTIPEVAFHGDASSCSDPTHCCLHKPDVFELSRSGSMSSGAGRTRKVPTPQAAFESQASMKKFEMGFSIKRACDDQLVTSHGHHVWAQTSADTFMVRCQDYKKSRRKQPSKSALFEFLGADVVQTNGKIDLISKRVTFPDSLANKRLFVVNIQLPSYAPILWGDNSNNGPGYCIVMYWRIPDDIVEELKSPKSTSVRLLKRFLEAGNDTSLTDRFKMIVQVVNHEECGLTGVARKLLVSHNATPLLTRPQHRIYHWNQITEVDIDVHIFSYIARRGLAMLLDKTTQLIVDVAFLVQGETEDELPEQILACGRFNRLNSNMARAI